MSYQAFSHKQPEPAMAQDCRIKPAKVRLAACAKAQRLATGYFCQEDA